MTFCAFKIHTASGSGRGKPLLISVLACSLGFHVITLERSIFMKIAFFKNRASVALNTLLSLFGRFLARGGRKRGYRHTYEPSTVTLAVHARRGLINV